MQVKFNETDYDQSVILAAEQTMRECLTSGWVVTGPETEKAEGHFSYLTGKKHGVGFGIAPFFPVAAALSYHLKKQGIYDQRVTIMATAWPEHIACFSAFGFEVTLADVTCDKREFPQFDIFALNSGDDYRPHVLFVPDIHGMCTQNITDIRDWCTATKCILVHDVSYGFYAKDSDHYTRYFGDVITMSLNPGKLVNGLNGGMATTDNPTLYECMKMARLDGLIQETKNCVIPVGDWRMLEIQASVLCNGVCMAMDYISQRVTISKLYDEAIQQNPALAPYAINDQWELSGMDRYTLRIPGKKQEFRDFLNEKGIQSVPLTYDHAASWHGITKICVDFGTNNPNADHWCDTHILIPLHNRLTDAEVAYVCGILKEVDIWK